MIVSGKSFEVGACACPDTGELKALKFLQNMHTNLRYSSYVQDFPKLLEHCAENGYKNLSSDLFHPTHKEKNNHPDDLSNVIYRFRKGPLRIACFIYGSKIILTNGYIKNSQKPPPEAIRLAIKIRNYYLENFKNDSKPGGKNGQPKPCRLV